MKFCPKCDRRFDQSETTCPDDGSPLLFVPEEDLTGTVIDERFKVQRMLGEGGMGCVYLAFQFSVNREVALKVVRRELATSERSIKRFMREAQASSKLRNPNTITVYDFGQTSDGLLFMAMEYLKGRPLDRVVAKEAPLDVKRAIRILGQVCNSLEEAHEEGIVHRDLKPPNLVIEDRAGFTDFVTVLDFGIARMTGDATDEVLTRTGTIVGSPRYMSPEQVKGGPIDHRSDLYSLAIVAYEMLCGSCPFAGGNTATVMSQHCTEAPTPLTKAHPGLRIPAPLDRFLMACLAKDPAARPQSAAEFKSRLELCLSDTVEAVPVVSSGRTATGRAAQREMGEAMTMVADVDDTAEAPAVVAPPPIRASVPQEKRGSGKKIWWAVAVAGAVAVLAVAAAVYFAGGSKEVAKPSLFEVLTDRPLVIAVMPLESAPERVLDKNLWPMADRALYNALMDDRSNRGRVLAIDPLVIEKQMLAREMAGAIAGAQAGEIGAAVDAQVVLEGSVSRVSGEVAFQVELVQVGGEAVCELEGRGADLFEAAADVADQLRHNAGEGAKADEAEEAHTLPGPFANAWAGTLKDPWTEHRYAALTAAAGEDATLRRLAELLAGSRGSGNECLNAAAEVGHAWPEQVGPLAEAVCRHRRLEYPQALSAAQRAFEKPALRRGAAALITKVDSQVRKRIDRERFLADRVALFPDDHEAWWLLAFMHATGSGPVEAVPTVKVASALSLGKEVSFPVALNAVRTTMQLRDFTEAEKWMEALDRAEPRSGWDVMWRGGRKNGLLQLRGRFGEAQRVLEETRELLAKEHGDPYTIVANALFYSYLHFGRLDEARAVAGEYLGFFEGTDKPDLWTARLLIAALHKARGELDSDAYVEEVRRLGDELGRAVGRAGKREQDAFVCLALAHGAPPAEVKRHFMQADPANKMVAGCRVVAAQVLLEEGRADEARSYFAQARADILYRSDWSYELYLPAMLGHARAAAKAGDAQGAKAIYAAIIEQYRQADRELDEVKAAAQGRRD